ncbi:Holliday junction resolvase RuvX [Aminivibrio sp.]|jgi:putative Holliday junction resolvase|uniref:Holliday junction resolvase RuvX n=1 Tax=Aminivibrio sp. TaxID=1872489 RepID=UPI002A1DE1D6|nr:Holliday junction resolvase RuvX [Synergistaceae bacterium]MDD4021516.1 Holliday junction resolvase RuvX [Synergistaceae bacterium]
MRRILALDIGTVRIGVAVSDPLGMFAQGIDVLPAEGNWLEQLDGLVKTYDPEILLLGIPIRTNGTRGPEALRIEECAEMLGNRYPEVKVQLHDERFSTTMAQQALLEGDVSRKGRKGKVDKVAAALILQSWLDRKAGGMP